jgi:hypothetical protein
MPLQKLQFRPGVNREGTTLANEGGWFETDKVRFRSGYPEKIGGWELDTGLSDATLQPPSGAYWGVARSLWNWLNLSGYNLLAIGTDLKYYIQNSADGSLYDVTPIRATTAAGDVTFAATNGSATITVTDSAHGAQTGDFVTFSGAVSLGGAITATVLNAEFQITYVSPSQYTITADVTANGSDVGSGGTATVGTYQINTGSVVYSLGTGWGVGVWGGATIGATFSTLNGAINSSATTITLVSNASFPTSGQVLIDSELIDYSGKGVNTLTGCTRGVESTTAASHSSGAIVQDTSAFVGWGDPAPASGGIGVQLRLWSESNYGGDLIFNPRGGAMYYWANNGNPNIFDRGQLLGPGATITTQYGSTTVDNYCPSVANIVLVSDSSRFIIAFGCNDYFADAPSQQNPLFIAWSAQENFAAWDPTDITQQAGTYQLSNGSEIVAVQQTRQEILVFTDAALYSMQYLGPPYVWGFQIMGDNISIISPNAVATANNITYWMGVDKFYMYSGRVETLPCAVRQYIYDNINLDQSYQVFSGTSEGYNEVWWFYCSITGFDGTGTVSNPNTTIDKYVVFNHLERTWYYGTMERTAWLDSSLRDVPIAAGYDGQIIYHEVGNDDGTTTPPTPIEAYVQSSDFDIGDGHNFGLVTRIIPDVTFDGSDSAQPTVTFTVRPRQNPGANYGTSNDPDVVSGNNYTNVREYNVQQFTQYVYVRVRGRQMAFRVGSSDLGVAWQLGAPRIDVRPDGRR